MADALWPWVVGAVALGGVAWAATRKSSASSSNACPIDPVKLAAWGAKNNFPTLYLSSAHPPPPSGASLQANFPEFANQAIPGRPTAILVLSDGTFWAYSIKLSAGDGGGYYIPEGAPTIRPDLRQSYCDFNPGALSGLDVYEAFESTAARGF